ncbi:MAG: hypothetical protein PVH88_17355 [Ignavibacteria bacterium]
MNKILFYLLTFSILFASSGYSGLCNCEKLKKHEQLTQSNCCCKPVGQTKSCCSAKDRKQSSKENKQETKICPGKFFKAKQENNTTINSASDNSKIEIEEITSLNSEEIIAISKIPKFLKYLQIKNLNSKSGIDIPIKFCRLKIPLPSQA